MGKRFKSISDETKKFIEEQKLFFVGTAADKGTVNISPKGTDSLRVLNENKIVWLNLTGSGNETAAHLALNSRMTLMFCSFDSKPLILRLYGTAKIYHERDKQFKDFIKLFPTSNGARQIVELEVELVQNSCGFAVPLMDFKKERETLTTWAKNKGREGIKEYWEEKNTQSLDGFDTKIFND